MHYGRGAQAHSQSASVHKDTPICQLQTKTLYGTTWDDGNSGKHDLSHILSQSGQKPCIGASNVVYTALDVYEIIPHWLVQVTRWNEERDAGTWPGKY